MAKQRVGRRSVSAIGLLQTKPNNVTEQYYVHLYFTTKW